MIISSIHPRLFAPLLTPWVSSNGQQYFVANVAIMAFNPK